MSSTQSKSRPRLVGPVLSTAGFTLIELLVALVISGIVAAAVFEFLLGQTRFARLQTAREEVQQNARATLEMIGGELRGVGPQGISAASANAITARVPRAWGVVCGNVNGVVTDVAVIFGEAPPAYRANTDSVAVRGADIWSFSDATDETASNATSTIDTCNAQLNLQPALSPGNAADVARVRLFRLSAAPDPATTRGELAYFYEIARYEVHTYPTNGNPSGTWIRRYVGNTPQPFAGPLAGSTGLRFEYRNGNNGNPAILDSIRVVKVVVHTQSTGKLNNNPQATLDSTLVFLRNRM